MYRKFFALIVLACLLIGAAARADALTVFYQPANAVAYHDPDERFAAPHDMQGVVIYFSHFDMTLRVNDRYYPVILHQGTIIKPTGTTLEPSMVINLHGYWADGSFHANRIVVLRY